MIFISKSDLVFSLSVILRPVSTALARKCWSRLRRRQPGERSWNERTEQRTWFDPCAYCTARLQF